VRGAKDTLRAGLRTRSTCGQERKLGRSLGLNRDLHKSKVGGRLRGAEYSKALCRPLWPGIRALARTLGKARVKKNFEWLPVERSERGEGKNPELMKISNRTTPASVFRPDTDFDASPEKICGS